MLKPALVLDVAVGGSTFHHRTGIVRHGLGPGLLLPEGDGHEDAAATAAAAKAVADKMAADAAAVKAKADAEAAKNGETDKGFPENTPVAEMTDKQAAAYWRHQSKKHESRATARADYDDVKAKAVKYDQIEAEKLTPSEKAVNEAREAGKKEAARDANQRAATAILRAHLKARGKTDEQVTSLVAATNVGAFLTEDDVDTDRVAAYANDIAGPVTGGGSRGPDHGQGNRGGTGRSRGGSVADVMADRAAARAAKNQT